MATKRLADSSVSAASADSMTPRPIESRERNGFQGSARRSWRTTQRYIWDDPDKPKEERWFLFKLDVFMLTISCLGYFSKGLDQANINNAYVSGMKEALSLKGNELTYAQNVFTAGYVIGQLPAVMLATRVRPSLLIPTVEILWSICTFCSATVKTAPQLYAVRFFVGLCESAYFPTVIYMLGSWYTKVERGKRLTIFYSTASISQMFSGYLQAAAYRNLNGILGHAGWQWLFIVCGIISLPIGILGYFFYPDFPETTRAFYITEKEAAWARKRLILEGLKPLGASKWDRTKIFRIMAHWQFWLLPLGYFFVQGSFPAYQPVFALWLKSTKHSVYEINVWPTGQIAVGLVVQILAGMISDSPLLRGKRWQVILVMQAGTFFGAVVLAAWPASDGLKYAAYYVLYFAAGVPGLWYAWYVDLIPHDHEMRGFVIASSNMFSYLQSLWFTIAVWRTLEAPRFKPAFIFVSILGVALVTLSLLIRFLELRDGKIRARKEHGLGDTEASSVPVKEPEKMADGAAPHFFKGETAAIAQP